MAGWLAMLPSQLLSGRNFVGGTSLPISNRPSIGQLARQPCSRNTYTVSVRASAPKDPHSHGSPSDNCWKGYLSGHQGGGSPAGRSRTTASIFVGASLSLGGLQIWQNRCEARAAAAPSSAQHGEFPADSVTSAQRQDSGGGDGLGPPQLTLITGGFVIPHPAKVAKGGEDAYYIAKGGRSFGIADGVGGWADAGVDPGEYSRLLMREARKAVEGEAKDLGADTPYKVLESAYERSQHVVGSSTACIVCLEMDNLHSANIGDSGYMVVRDGKLIYESPSQQHSFNFPFQIGSYGDPVTACDLSRVQVRTGDIIIAGSDGLLDNVFNQRSGKLVWDAKARGATPGVAAQQLANFASARAKDPIYLSPFAKSAREHGFYYQGGKVDDITVLVAYVTAVSDVVVADNTSKL